MKLKKLKKVIPEVPVDTLQLKMQAESIKRRNTLYDIIKNRLTKKYGPIKVFWETELDDFVAIPRKLNNNRMTMPIDRLTIIHQLLVNPKSQGIFNLIRIFNYYCMIIDVENVIKYISPNASKDTALRIVTLNNKDPWSLSMGASKSSQEIKEIKIAIIYDSWDDSL